MKYEYTNNLPKIKDYDTRQDAAKQELFAFMIELNQKHKLTPSQELAILNEVSRFTLSQCTATERKNSE